MHNVFDTPSRLRPAAALGALLAVAALAACDRPNAPQTPTQRGDVTTSRAEQRANPAREAKPATGEVAQSTESGGKEVSNKVKDAAITTAVNAKIATDPKLSMMRINVDTVNGRVLLKGAAPDTASSQRAEQLASSVDGVVSVDNQLVVGGKG